MGDASATGGTLPSPPFITIPGLDNLRDAGGYPIANQPGKAVRRGIVFRAAEPSNVDDVGATILTDQLGITHIYDLRSGIELAKKPGLAWDAGGKAKRVFVPVFTNKDYSPEALAVRFRNYSDGPEGFVLAYAAILASAAEPEHEYAPYRTILEHLGSDTPPTPLLLHCTAGKDRTGVIVALVLSLLGVEDEAIAHEYSLTDLGLAARKIPIVERLIVTTELDHAGAETMVSSRKENMMKTLEMIRVTYGSAEQYVVDHCKVSPAHVEQLRRNLTVDVSAAEPVLDWKEHAKLLDVSHIEPALEEKEQAKPLDVSATEPVPEGEGKGHTELLLQGKAPTLQPEVYTPQPSL